MYRGYSCSKTGEFWAYAVDGLNIVVKVYKVVLVRELEDRRCETDVMA